MAASPEPRVEPWLGGHFTEGHGRHTCPQKPEHRELIPKPCPLCHQLAVQQGKRVPRWGRSEQQAFTGNLRPLGESMLQALSPSEASPLREQLQQCERSLPPLSSTHF